MFRARARGTRAVETAPRSRACARALTWNCTGSSPSVWLRRMSNVLRELRRAACGGVRARGGVAGGGNARTDAECCSGSACCHGRDRRRGAARARRASAHHHVTQVVVGGDHDAEDVSIVVVRHMSTLGGVWASLQKLPRGRRNGGVTRGPPLRALAESSGLNACHHVPSWLVTSFRARVRRMRAALVAAACAWSSSGAGIASGFVAHPVGASRRPAALAWTRGGVPRPRMGPRTRTTVRGGRQPERRARAVARHARRERFRGGADEGRGAQHDADLPARRGRVHAGLGARAQHLRAEVSADVQRHHRERRAALRRDDGQPGARVAVRRGRRRLLHERPLRGEPADGRPDQVRVPPLGHRPRAHPRRAQPRSAFTRDTYMRAEASDIADDDDDADTRAEEEELVKQLALISELGESTEDAHRAVGDRDADREARHRARSSGRSSSCGRLPRGARDGGPQPDLERRPKGKYLTETARRASTRSRSRSTSTSSPRALQAEIKGLTDMLQQEIAPMVEQTTSGSACSRRRA